jgi:hypothetical protein
MASWSVNLEKQGRASVNGQLPTRVNTEQVNFTVIKETKGKFSLGGVQSSHIL